MISTGRERVAIEHARQAATLHRRCGHSIGLAGALVLLDYLDRPNTDRSGTHLVEATKLLTDANHHTQDIAVFLEYLLGR